MKKLLVVSILVMCSFYAMAQQDSVIVVLTDLQKEKFELLKEREDKLIEQYKSVAQQIQNEKNELLVLIADFKAIKKEDITDVKLEKDSAIFYIKIKN